MNTIKLIITLIVILSIYESRFYIDGKQNKPNNLLINSKKISKHNNVHNKNKKINSIKRIKTINISQINELVAANFDSSTKDLYHRKLRFSVLSLFLPWLYFMCVSINIPSYPKLINYVINKGNTDVSSLSSKVYGNITGLDAFFTFLSVNLIGCLSDRYGRKIFMFISSLGLGLAYLIASFATLPKHFYISACMDGLTSCMLSQSQAYITDFSTVGSNLSIELSKFQGIVLY